MNAWALGGGCGACDWAAAGLQPLPSCSCCGGICPREMRLAAIVLDELRIFVVDLRVVRSVGRGPTVIAGATARASRKRRFFGKDERFLPLPCSFLGYGFIGVREPLGTRRRLLLALVVAAAAQGARLFRLATTFMASANFKRATRGWRTPFEAAHRDLLLLVLRHRPGPSRAAGGQRRSTLRAKAATSPETRDRR